MKRLGSLESLKKKKRKQSAMKRDDLTDRPNERQQYKTRRIIWSVLFCDVFLLRVFIIINIFLFHSFQTNWTFVSSTFFIGLVLFLFLIVSIEWFFRLDCDFFFREWKQIDFWMSKKSYDLPNIEYLLK